MTQAIRFGPFLLDSTQRQLTRAGVPLRLTPKAYELLRALAESRPRVLSKAEIKEAVWPGMHIADEGLPRLINEIRAALEDSASNPRWIRTVHGFGYGLAPDEGPSAEPAYRFTVSYLGRAVPLADGEHLIGRLASASIHVTCPSVSRRHARILVTGDEAILEDMGSKNGTYLGRTKVTGSQRLENGDEIKIGELTIVFRWAGHTPTQTYHTGMTA